jgi:hypothetical protein
VKDLKEVAELMFELFQGRRSVYAIKKMGRDGKKLFVPARDDQGNDLELTVDVLVKHLSGEIAAGIYVLEGEATRIAAIDFDGKRGDVLKDALEVQDKLLKTTGITTWLETSQSGNGMHLWAFFNQPIKATALRAVFGNCIPDFATPTNERKTSYDRLFPVQDRVYEGQYGSLVGLPMNGSKNVAEGKTAFVNREGKPDAKQSETLAQIAKRINQPEVIGEAIKKLPKVSRKDQANKPKHKPVPGGMKLLSPFGCDWLRTAYENAYELEEPQWFAALGQFAKLENGDLIAHQFSKPYKDYDFNTVQRKYEHEVKKDIPMKCTTIQKENWCKGPCTCQELGCTYPWELAKIPLSQLERSQSGIIYSAKDLAESAITVVKEVDAGNRIGFPWGYDILDDITELRPRNLVIVAARRSMGKTAIMIDASVRGAERGIPQYVFSLEMSAEDLALRYLARISGVDHTLLTVGGMGEEEWKKTNAAKLVLEQMPIYVDDSTRNAEKMLDKAGEMVYRYGQGCMWVDYLQLVQKQANESRKDAVDNAIYAYKNIAKIIDVPVTALAQFNRGEETYEGDDDLDSWLKDTGNIEQHSDVIHYIRGRHRPGVVIRRWIVHKERYRAAGMKLKFEFIQGLFRLEPVGKWSDAAENDGDNVYELSGSGDGFEGIEENQLQL